MNDKVWQSYVFHGGRAFFVSTIGRDFDTAEGRFRGRETIAWEWDPETRLRGDSVFDCGHGVRDHAKICQDLIVFGEVQTD